MSFDALMSDTTLSQSWAASWLEPVLCPESSGKCLVPRLPVRRAPHTPSHPFWIEHSLACCRPLTIFQSSNNVDPEFSLIFFMLLEGWCEPASLPGQPTVLCHCSPKCRGPAGRERAGEGQTLVVLDLERGGLVGVWWLSKKRGGLTPSGSKEKRKEPLGSGRDPGPCAEGKGLLALWGGV